MYDDAYTPQDGASPPATDPEQQIVNTRFAWESSTAVRSCPRWRRADRSRTPFCADAVKENGTNGARDFHLPMTANRLGRSSSLDRDQGAQ